MSDLPEIIEDWTSIASERLQDELDIEAHRADELAGELVSGICNEYAGLQFYIPVCYAQKISARNLAIFEAYDGKNGDEVCRKFGVTRRVLYSAIRRAKSLELKRVQPDMFSAD